jgi:hypothetical protein
VGRVRGSLRQSTRRCVEGHAGGERCHQVSANWSFRSNLQWAGNSCELRPPACLALDPSPRAGAGICPVEPASRRDRERTPMPLAARALRRQEPSRPSGRDPPGRPTAPESVRSGTRAGIADYETGDEQACRRKSGRLGCQPTPRRPTAGDCRGALEHRHSLRNGARLPTVERLRTRARMGDRHQRGREAPGAASKPWHDGRTSRG